jgi:tetratricopeptide (TPR) repeat protein
MTPAQIGRYVVKGELGRGSMGVVYRAVDPRLRREVAIKLVLPTGDRARLLRRLSVEAVALGRLRHEAIVTIHEVGEHEGLPYLVMDLVEGRSLQDRLDREGPLAPREAARVARLLAVALAHAHARGVLHRDVKPSNVLLTSDGGAVLTDFGLARDAVAASGVSQAGNMIGTPGYWPPEQARGKTDEVGPASDVYALGATLFAMLTGQPPFVEDSFFEMIAAACSTPAPAPSSQRIEVDPALDEITLKALEKSPADRHASAEAMAAALERYLQVGDPVRRRRRRAPGRRRLGPGLVGAGVVLACLVAALALRDRPAVEAPAPAASVAPAPSAVTLAAADTAADGSSTARAAYLEGLALQVKGRHADARARFDAALAAAPDLVPALVRRAQCRAPEGVAGGDVAGAAADFARAIALQGDWDAAPWFHRGRARNELKDFAGAAEDLTRALALAPESIAAAISCALALIPAERLADALAGLTALIERRPDQWVASYYRGWARARHGADHTGGLEDLTRVVAVAPRVTSAWRERAWCRLKLADPAGARVDLDRALELDPTDVETWDLYAEACGQLGDAPAMERAASQVIRYEPERASAWSDRSTARLLLRDLTGALSDLEEALARDPGWKWPLGQRARLRALLGDRGGALADFARASVEAPDDEYHPLWMAGLGAPDPARLGAIAASKSWMAGLARRALGQGTDAEALAFVDQGETDKDRRERACVILGFLGVFAERDGDLAAARAHYRACLALRRFLWAQHQWSVNRLEALGR